MPSTALLALVLAGAALLHGMVGIGVTLIPTAVLAMSMDMREAVVLTLVPMLLINLLSLVSGGPFWSVLRRYGVLAVCSVIGSLIGVKLLLLLPQAWLQLGLAAVIALYVFTAVRQVRLDLPRHPAVGAAFGLAGGIVGGAANAMSSVLMMYLLTQSRDKDEIAQAANLCFALGKLTQLWLLWPLLTAMQIPAPVLIWPSLAAVAALSVGVWLRRRIPFHRFRQLSLLILSLLALMMVYKSLSSLMI